MSRTRLVPLALLLACGTPPSGELPPSVLDLTPPVGRLVQAADLSGYLVRPTDRSRAPAVLLLVETLDEANRNWAMERSRDGWFVLVIEPSTPTARARAYLSGIDGIERVSVECQRTECPAPESDGQTL